MKIPNPLSGFTLQGKLIAVGILTIVAVVFVVLIVNKFTSQSEKVGRSEVTIEAQDQALDNIGDANEARDTIDERPVGQRNADCVRDARNAGNC